MLWGLVERLGARSPDAPDASDAADDERAFRARVAERQRQRDLGPIPPPSCPEGWTTGPPDFVGVGTVKSGTTWWFNLLTRHPGIRRSVRKELHFFDHASSRELTDDDVATYHRYFPRPPGAIVGEWTPRYLDDLWTPPRLARAAPGARFLVLVRDPIERFRSNVTHVEVRSDNPHPRFLVENAMRGLYAAQLDRLARHVPRAQILVLQYERCVADPVGQLARTLRFLGVDDGFAPPDIDQPVYAARRAHRDLPADLLAELCHLYEPDVARLVADGWDVDVVRWPRFAHLAG